MKIEDKDFSQYYKEIPPLEKDLSDSILQRIQSQKEVQLHPATMPSLLLWGIIGILLGLMAIGLSMVENISLNLWENIQIPSFPNLPDLEVTPILMVIMPTLAIVIWFLILMEKKIMKAIL
ncbi:hypothetical protein [Cyclobacterium sp.]|uniref:hypothetical protein n=1 Tax=Cyclobacterium sp. TaxID=1966343 RepID=UPI0019C1A077|nr:hypothetical protein [Cyclobacterium sp.]MBD3627540.1 hypothetical protein [Cyclobacterium sp.]